jgi:hypothetical protein
MKSYLQIIILLIVSHNFCSAQKVGIGQPSPAFKLDVKAQNATIAQFEHDTSSNDKSAYIKIKNNDTLQQTWIQGAAATGNNLGVKLGTYILGVEGKSPDLYIDQSGNFGLGQEPVPVFNSTNDIAKLTISADSLKGKSGTYIPNLKQGYGHLVRSNAASQTNRTGFGYFNESTANIYPASSIGLNIIDSSFISIGIKAFNPKGLGVYSESFAGSVFVNESQLSASLTVGANGGGNGIDIVSKKGFGIKARADSNFAAGYFYTENKKGDDFSNGVLRSEYLGNDSTFDHVGVYSDVMYDKYKTYYGIGVKAVAGWIGVEGIAKNKGNSGDTRGVSGIAFSEAGTTAYGIFGSVNGAGTNYAGYFDGNLYATSAASGVKAFMIDHPLDPANKILRHSSIESPDMMNVYNGNCVTNENGLVSITLPEYFEALNENFKYQVTCIGTFAQVMIKEEISHNQFVIQSDKPNVKLSWQVSGVRKDPVAKKYKIIVEENKPFELRGKYYTPEAYNQPKASAIDSKK